MKQSETKKDITKLIKQYSLETNIPAEFVEKDIYVVKVLHAISKMSYPNAKIVFSGGTCLSKAHGKIKRFSEDIDFCVKTSVQFSRKDKSHFRKFIIEELSKSYDFKVIQDKIIVTDENNFFSFGIEYNPIYEIPTGIRKNIKVEFKFENLALQTSTCSIKSLLHPYINDVSVNIECIDILEVMANKLSALLWRCYTKDRSKQLYSIENDPTIMRHLYDISVLSSELMTSEFAKLVNFAYEKDISRGNNRKELSFVDFAKSVVEKICKDKLFKKEYEQFVGVMCYSEKIMPFEQAVDYLNSLIDFIENFSN